MNTNVSAVRRDMRDIVEGKQKMDGGQVALAFSLVPLLGSILVHKYKEADGTEYTDDFVVCEFVTNKPRNAKGEFHKTLQGLRRNAILSDIFGYGSEAFDNQVIKAALDKAMPSAIALAHYYSADTANKLSLSLSYMPGDVEGRKRVIVGIPASDMFELSVTAEDGTVTLTNGGKAALRKMTESFFEAKGRVPKDEAELIAFMLNRKIPTTGNSHPTFGVKAPTAVQFLDALKARAIADGVLPPPPPRAPQHVAGKPSALVDAVALVSTALDTVLKSDEAESVDFTYDLERKLDEIAERWAAYRIAYPRELI